jgi:hypothetical protein
MNRTRVTSFLLGCVFAPLLLEVACGGQTLDAGSDTPHGLLPVDDRNPIILSNDNYDDNWQGVFAVLFANTGGRPWPVSSSTGARMRQTSRRTLRPGRG